MKRFTVRLEEELDEKLKLLFTAEDTGKADIIRRLIKEEYSYELYKIDIGTLVFLYNTAGIEMPEDLKYQWEQVKTSNVNDPLSKEQKDKLALSLIQKEREGKILDKDQAEFVNKWLDEERTRRKNRDIMKKHGVEEKEMKSKSELK